MSAYRNALFVDAHSPDERLAHAASILSSGASVVVLESDLALRLTGKRISCEVIDRTPAARRCEVEFEVLVENAQRMLEASRLEAVLPDFPRRWSVVEDDGRSIIELWRAPG